MYAPTRDQHNLVDKADDLFLYYDLFFAIAVNNALGAGNFDLEGLSFASAISSACSAQRADCLGNSRAATSILIFCVVNESSERQQAQQRLR